MAGSGFWSARISQILSNFLYDDLESLIGCDVYERMARDPVVSKNIQFQKLSVTSEGVQLHPAVSKPKAGETDPAKLKEFQLAQEIKDFHQRSLDGLHRPITQIIGEMLVALKRSHSVAEITYKEPTAFGADPYKLLLKSIKVKPRNTTAFVIDAFRNVLGLTAWRYGTQGAVPATQMLDGQAIIDPEKFAVLAFDTEDEDPRGNNPLRPAYNFWQAKCLVPALHLKWLEKSGLPTLVGFTAPNAGYEQPVDSSERPETDGSGNPVVKSAQEVMASMLAKAESGSALAFPEGAKVEKVEVASRGEQFKSAYDSFDQQLDYALSLQSGATKDSVTGSYASKNVFKSVLDILVWSRKHTVAQVIYGVLKNGTRYNFGDENAHLTPLVMIGDEEVKDWATDAEALVKLAPSLTDSQWNSLCMELGIPPPDEGEELPSRAKPTPAVGADPAQNQPPPNQPPDGGPKK